MAPDLLGRILGHGFLEGALGADVLPELCEPIEGAEPRRALVAASLKYLKVKPLSLHFGDIMHTHLPPHVCVCVCVRVCVSEL
jgi:hypothetical protein